MDKGDFWYIIIRIICLLVLVIIFWVVCADAKTNKHSALNKRDGVFYFNGQKETYYNLPMDRILKKAEERLWVNAYWVREDGVKMFGSYVIVAAPFDVHPWGSLVETSLGTGIVLDTGLFAVDNKNQIDIATSW